MAPTQLPLLPYLEHQESERPEDFIPVYEPWLGEREAEYVLDAVHSGWISSLGKYVVEFEDSFAAFCGVAHGVSTSNGTTALHLALHALGVGPGDEVIVPALTFVASANAVAYTGARPVFADVDPDTWTLLPQEVERLATDRTRAVMPVHLYGHPAPMGDITDIAASRELWVLEDAAEAHGARVGPGRVGSLGHIAAFSFFANKIITTGEGGMLTTGDPQLAARCRKLRDHAMPPERRYWHDEVGFNYRMTNLQAAVGVAQMDRIDEFIARKRQIAGLYAERLSRVPGIVLPVERPGYTNVYWMYSIRLDENYPLSRDELIVALRQRGIDSRPFFHSLDTLPPYRNEKPLAQAFALSATGLNLPSSPRLSDGQVCYICDTVKELAGYVSHGR
jgi:perosamine synthetase